MLLLPVSRKAAVDPPDDDDDDDDEDEDDDEDDDDDDDDDAEDDADAPSPDLTWIGFSSINHVMLNGWSPWLVVHISCVLIPSVTPFSK